MGASYFTAVAWGRTPEQAFGAAHEHAQYMHGHGGYSGTIAEKHDFVLVEMPPRVTVRRFSALLERLDSLASLEWRREDLTRLQAELLRVGTADKRDVRRRIKVVEAEIKKAEKEEARWARDAGPLVPLLRRAYGVAHGDKWGPCLALEIKVASDIAWLRYAPEKPKRGYRLFLFQGYASS